mmetsp:Transcript_11210/g.12812  ORF Transcript_11210/g.12812 Transcript_11210/m.12812 type:complete len:152 (-) Transcript_11210:236-691(-)|eukprot:CAMPEP_0194369318 /NCGR_PEP_ID=MMETSP0174-20130528/17606_1 /TAXON_ID=216777 /ORGANISM="Proboscia alata, Strain PI-D3" /LENGTH=151 /DNA_ID=CAMNT_0039146189 /DNA_START=157 /DNA_END=612 /DNA_ORIENTATION=-
MMMTRNERWLNALNESNASSRELQVHALAHLGFLDLAISRARAHPEEIKYRDKHGRSVLHHVLRKNPSLSNLQDLLDMYPEAIDQQDSFDRSPVDIAICYGANSDVVEYMESKQKMYQHRIDDDVADLQALRLTPLMTGKLTTENEAIRLS